MDALAAEFQRQVWRGTALLAACAVLFVFFGPVLDHHFAERQAGHSHLSLSGSLSGHVHFFEAEDGHSHLHPPPGQSLAGGSAPANDVVNLTSSDGIGAVFSGLGGPISNDAPAMHGPDTGALLFRFFDDGAARSGAFVPPPKRPPRI